MNQQFKTLLPGHIELDWIPTDWPLVPVNKNKQSKLSQWQKPGKELAVHEIKRRLEDSNDEHTGVALRAGPVPNKPYGFVWVDIDGPEAITGVLERQMGKTLDDLTPTLTIRSGRPGRYRKLYRLPVEVGDAAIRGRLHFKPRAEDYEGKPPKDMIEVFWSGRYGILMGPLDHPEAAAGYFTDEGFGFEHVNNIPPLPEFLLHACYDKQTIAGPERLGGEQHRTANIYSAQTLTKTVKYHIRQLEKSIAWCAKNAPDIADDRDEWLKVGMGCHAQFGDEGLALWVSFSQLSDKFVEGECDKKWQEFDDDKGIGIGSFHKLLKDAGCPDTFGDLEDDYRNQVPDDELDALAEKAQKATAVLEIPQELERIEQLKASGEPPAPPKGLTAKKKKVPVKAEREQKPRNPPVNEIADIVLQQLKGNLRFAPTGGGWFAYEHKHDGLWSKVSPDERDAIILECLEEQKTLQLISGYSGEMIKNVGTILRLKTRQDQWYEGNNFLLFRNGVFDVERKEFDTDLSGWKEIGFINQLPFDWDWDADDSDDNPIVKWLNWSQYGDKDVVLLLLHMLRCILLSHHDVQRFFEIVGPGRTGKSTFQALCTGLVGPDNSVSIDLRKLDSEAGRFSMAELEGKKLAIAPDQGGWGGTGSVIKNITGGDPLTAETKNDRVPQHQFVFKGILLTTSNEDLRSTDGTTGMLRRRLYIPFTRVYRGETQREPLIANDYKTGEIYGQLAPAFPGLVKRLLTQLNTSDMYRYLQNTEKYVPSLRKTISDQHQRTNPMMQWMEEELVYCKGRKVLVGRKLKGTDGTTPGKNEYLYPNYVAWCEENGHKETKTVTKFTKEAQEMLRDHQQLGGLIHFKEITPNRADNPAKRKEKMFFNLELRSRVGNAEFTPLSQLSAEVRFGDADRNRLQGEPADQTPENPDDGTNDLTDL